MNGAHPEVRLRTAAFYGDHALTLAFPAGWEVRTFWPATPVPLMDAQIGAALERPVGQPPLRLLAQGKSRPLILVDDLTRPTPVERVLPFVLRQFEEAGVPRNAVTVLMATGTHGAGLPGGVARKVGREVAASCRLLTHDHLRNVVKIGRTSFGTPVWANREVVASDLVLGIGGIYPQHPHWFGGGSKLALGVLGERSIARLHFRHGTMTTVYGLENDFRRDLDEIASMIRLVTSVSLHVDADRQIVRAVSGDHLRYYQEAATFSKHAFSAPLPTGFDVVIANAYPVDTSLTFAVFKGMTPLVNAPRNASRVLIAACSEGGGHHGLFPLLDVPKFHHQRQRIRRVLSMKPAAVRQKVANRLRARLRNRGGPSAPGSGPAHPVLLHRPAESEASLPPDLPGLMLLPSWSDVLDTVKREQGHGKPLRVAVYPCSPLQCLDLEPLARHSSSDEGP